MTDMGMAQANGNAAPMDPQDTEAQASKAQGWTGSPRAAPPMRVFPQPPESQESRVPHTGKQCTPPSRGLITVGRTVKIQELGSQGKSE